MRKATQETECQRKKKEISTLWYLSPSLGNQARDPINAQTCVPYALKKERKEEKKEKKKKKDALTLFLEGPMGRIKKMPVYYYYFKVQTSCWQKWVMWTVRTTSSVSKPTATLHCLCYWQEDSHSP